MKSYYALTYIWIFLPLVMLFYQAFPARHRWKVLLAGSYLFYWIIAGKLLAYLLAATVIVYVCGIWLSKLQERKSAALAEAEKSEKKELRAYWQKRLRAVMLLGVLSSLAILLVLKYTEFFGTNINTLLEWMGVSFQFKIPKFLLPLGISFYTLEAMSYLIDIYRGTIQADRHPGRVALYLSFFPQIMEGPICRYQETAGQLWAGEKITAHNLSWGSQRLIFGIFKKMVIADHMESVLFPIFAAENVQGLEAALAAVCYTLQLYMEFSGTMDMVIGSSEIFGIRLTENFTQPFFARTVSEFWLRWHITLGTWFKDYVFYPVSVSKRLKKRLAGIRGKYGNRSAAVLSGAIALFCVWVCNGLWHGDDWQYLFFGMYHFVLILTGVIAEPYTTRLTEKMGIRREGRVYRLFCMFRTAILVCIGELFFRADSLSRGFAMFYAMVTDFNIRDLNFAYLANRTLDKRMLAVLGAALLMVLAVSVLREKKIDPRELLQKQCILVRWMIYYLVIFFILFFGAFGPGYHPIDPIYANF